MRSSNIMRLDLSPKRRFNWRAFAILVALCFLGNLGGIPLQVRIGIPIEPPRLWMTATLISAGVIAIGLLAASRTGLGAPVLEGLLPKADRTRWFRNGLAYVVLMVMVGSPISLLANRGIDPGTYPLGWELLTASFKAGVVEEIFSRLLLVSGFTWIGRLLWHENDGSPTHGVYWGAILLAGLMFGWAHVDSQMGTPGASFGDYTLIMTLSTLLGIYFGWLYWRLGLEWAMLAHFAYDVFISMVVIPVYLLRNPGVWVLLVSATLLSARWAWNYLTGDSIGASIGML